jgi:acetyl esterase/lipase
MASVTDAADLARTTSPTTSRPAAPGEEPKLPSDVTFFAARTGPGSARHPLVLVFPGGAYREHADHEGAGPARWLASIGLNALVVRYPLAPAHYPSQLLRAREVLAAARSGALGLPVDRTRIGVLGFSAGGHLAALLSSLVTVGTPEPTDRADLAVLAYPVISLANEPHEESVVNLLGEGATPAERRALSAENLVDDCTPPTFLWHTADDGGVPVSHSLRYASALAAHTVPFDLHVFERGEHGKGLARGLGPLEAWTSLCEAWLRQRGWLEARA